jgi:hypothetical protein
MMLRKQFWKYISEFKNKALLLVLISKKQKYYYRPICYLRACKEVLGGTHR